MHGTIRSRLEDLLGKGPADPNVGDHLASCPECASEFGQMKRHSAQLAVFRGPELDPQAGFYARVLQRIEEQEPICFWSFFVDSAFSKRLAIVSVSVAVAMGSYVISQESREKPLVPGILVMNATAHYDAPVIGTPAEQRDAVLANFASHRSGENQEQLR